jgi:hypothetical protein
MTPPLASATGPSRRFDRTGSGPTMVLWIEQHVGRSFARRGIVIPAACVALKGIATADALMPGVHGEPADREQKDGYQVA